MSNNKELLKAIQFTSPVVLLGVISIFSVLISFNHSPVETEFVPTTTSITQTHPPTQMIPPTRTQIPIFDENGYFIGWEP